MSFKDAEEKPLSAGEIRELDTPALNEEFQRLREAQFRLQFRADEITAPGSEENTARLRILRRNLARIQTVLSERRQA